MPPNPAVNVRSKILRPLTGLVMWPLTCNFCLSGRRDLNPRPLDPQSASGCRWASLRRVHWVLELPEEWLSAGGYGLEPVRAGSWIGSCCLARRDSVAPVTVRPGARHGHGVTVVNGCWRTPGQGVLCLGSVPEDGSARGAGSGFVVPRVGRMRARRLCRWLMRSRHGLAGVRGDSRAGQPCGRDRGPGSRRCG